MILFIMSQFEKLNQNRNKTIYGSNNLNQCPDEVNHWSNCRRGYTGLINSLT